MGTSCSKETAANGDAPAQVSPGRPKQGPGPTAPNPQASVPAATAKQTTKHANDNGPKIRYDNVRDVYKFGRSLGQGGFATVREVTHRTTGEQFACKVMTLPKEGAQLSPDEFTREDIFKEIEILMKVDHPNVMYMKECFIATDKVYLICEYLPGGELLDAVLKNERYGEADARQAFVQLLEGLQYLHDMGIVHRDLKLENLLLARKDDIGSMKIADFGLAKSLDRGQAQTVCGTPAYVSAEVISGGPGHKYGPKVDLWSAGVVLFILLAGYPPFHDNSETAMFQKIRRGDFNFNDPAWDDVSEDAKDLIRNLIVVDPNKRLSAAEALQHRWIMRREPSRKVLRIDKDRIEKTLSARFAA